MSNRSGSARKKLNVKEEAEGHRHISAAKEGLLLMRGPKANLAPRTFNELIPAICRDFLFGIS
jgi:hypothetical protein